MKTAEFRRVRSQQNRSQQLGCGALLLLLLVVVGLMPLAVVGGRASPGTALGLAASAVLVLLVLLVSQFRSDACWRRASLACAVCGCSFGPKEAIHLQTHRVCPRCGHWPFEETAEDAIAPVVSTLDSARFPAVHARVEAVSNAESNPFAAPRTTTDTSVVGIAQFPWMWLTLVGNATRQLLLSDQRILEEADRRAVELVGTVVREEFRPSELRGTRRGAAVIVLLGAILPLAALIAVLVMKRSQLAHWHVWFVALLSAPAMLLAGLVTLAVVRGRSARFRAWCHGDPPPLVSRREPPTAPANIRLYPSSAGGTIGTPRLRVRVRVEPAAPLTAVLIDRDAQVQFETSTPWVGTDWMTLQMDFGALLGTLGGAYRWTELWLLPPDGAHLELEIPSLAMEPSNWPFDDPSRSSPESDNSGPGAVAGNGRGGKASNE